MPNEVEATSSEAYVFDSHEFTVVPEASVPGGPWFVFHQVASYLGLSNNASKLLAGVSEGDTQFARLTTSNGGKQHVRLINEPTLYHLIFKSRKAEARAFKDYVFREVLPSIRKTGKYETKAYRLAVLRKDADSIVNVLRGKYMTFRNKADFSFSRGLLLALGQETGMEPTAALQSLADREWLVEGAAKADPAKWADYNNAANGDEVPPRRPAKAGVMRETLIGG